MSSFSPAVGPVGTSVTITGNNFSNISTNNIVFFGAVRAVVNSCSSTSINVTVPAGATYRPITVTVNGLTGWSKKPFVITFSGGLPIFQTPGPNQKSFERQAEFLTGLKPNDVTIADFDGDGWPDIATPNNYSVAGEPASVSVLKNAGAVGMISFSSKQDIATGVLTYAIASGDLDGDGKPDLVSSSIVDQTISVFKNLSSAGTIAFAPKVDYPTGNNPFSIAISDMDNDGKAELIVANYFSNSFSVFKNISSVGAISFAPKSDFTTAFGPRCLAAGDIDGDGKSDVVIVNEFVNTVSVFRNTGATGASDFAARLDYPTGGNPQGVALGDLDADGKIDIVTANNSTNNYSVLRNTASAGVISFATKIDFACGSSPFSISIDDFNGDGKPEISVPSINLSVSQNNCTAGIIAFATPTFLFPSPTLNTAAIGDLDLDGKNDLIGAAFTVSKVLAFRNKNNEPFIGYFSPLTAATGAIVSIYGYDFDGATAVYFGGTAAASFNIVNSTTITAVVGNAVSGDVSVVNQYGANKLSGFTFAGPPIISSFTPNSGGTNDTINIRGKNLSGATSIRFGGIAANSFSIVSPDSATAIVGLGGSGDISVTTPYGTTIKGGFLFLRKPIISSFSPTSAAAGTTISISGLNFTGTTAVNIGNVQVNSFTVQNDNTILAVVGPGASGNVSITNLSGTGSKSGFIFLPPPTITTFLPTSGQTGSEVIITGTNFTGATQVKVGNVTVNSFTVLKDDSLKIIIGSGASGDIAVTSPGGTDIKSGFTFIGPPSITSVASYSGVNGSNIIIAGTGFSSSSTVKVGTVPAKIVSSSMVSITAVVPQTASNGELIVTARNLNTTSDLKFKTVFPATDTGFNQNSFAPAQTPIFGGDDRTIGADLDNDGMLELLVPDGNNKKIRISRNLSYPGVISFAPATELNCLWIPSIVIAKDLDGDGRVDILCGNIDVVNSFSIFKNLSTDGVINFAARQDYLTRQTSFMEIACGDIDGDGRFDIAVKTATDSVGVYRNKSLPGQIMMETPVYFFVGDNGNSNYKIYLNDLDGDLKPEIIANKPNLLCLKNNSTPGTVSFSLPILISPTNVNSFIDTDLSDLDNDGRIDIAAIINQRVSVFRNQSSSGAISFTEHFIYNYPSGTNYNILLTDLNGDGKEEIISRKAPFFSIFKNESNPGSVAFANPINYPGLAFQGPMQTADIDGDSKMDLLISTNPMTIHRNLMGYTSVFACGGSSFAISSNLQGLSYQWQENSGNGFVNISDNSNFSGTQTPNIYLTGILDSWYGKAFRCVINQALFSNETVIKIRNVWTGAVSSSWENPLNWSCGQIPESNSDVIVNGGTVIISANTSIRSLIIKTGAAVVVQNGIVLTVRN